MPPLRLAVAQIAMHWELDDNVAAMRRALRVARDAGARVCAFAELAVTGFHRRIAEGARPERAGPAVDAVRATAASLGIATVFGAPAFDADGRPRIGYLFVDARGERVGTVEKAGLTGPEATFFAAGTARPVLALAGRRCTAVVCREIEDADALAPALAAAAPEVVFWPGGMRPDPALPPSDPPRYVVQAQDLARRLRAHVVQINWPNALNRPEEGALAGRSACIAPDGTLLFRLPAGSGVAVFELGARAFDWHPADP